MFVPADSSNVSLTRLYSLLTWPPVCLFVVVGFNLLRLLSLYMFCSPRHSFDSSNLLCSALGTDVLHRIICRLVRFKRVMASLCTMHARYVCVGHIQIQLPGLCSYITSSAAARGRPAISLIESARVQTLHPLYQPILSPRPLPDSKIAHHQCNASKCGVNCGHCKLGGSRVDRVGSSSNRMVYRPIPE